MDTQSLAYKEIPDNKLQGRMLTNISSTDWWFSAISMLILTATGIWLYKFYGNTIPAIFAVMTGLVLWYGLMVRRRSGFYRLYAEISKGIAFDLKQMIIGSVLWQANDPDGAIVRWFRDRKGKRPPLPLNFAVIRAEIEGKVERVAVLRELDRPYDHVYFTAEGGSFATHDPSMQMRLVDMLASLTNQVVSLAELKLGITYLRILSPYNESNVTSFFGSNMNPLIARPDDFELDDKTREWALEMQKPLNELRPAAHSFGGARPMGVVKLTIKRDRKVWRKARGGKFSNEELYDLPVVELSRTMAESLASNSLFGFKNVKVLGLADLADFMRSSLDVTDIQDYYAARAAGEIPTTDDEIDAIVAREGVVGLNARLQCFPRKCIELPKQGKWLRIDGTYFSVLRVTQLPVRARADQFLNIHHLAPPGVWTRIATVGQSVSGSTETRNLILQASALGNMQHLMYSHRVVQDPRQRRKREIKESQTEEISATSIAQFFNILVVVAADSEQAVLRNRRTMKARLQGAGFESQNVDDIPHIENAVYSGALGVNRL